MKREAGVPSVPSSRPQAFSHEALFYAGIPEFVEGNAAFIRQGLEADEAVLVVVGGPKQDLLRDELGEDADRVRFADMADVGLNPARIIPAWRDFVNEHAPSARPFRGIGEPIWAERSPAALIECQRHESLLNLAFDGAPPWRLLCPYDTSTLAPDVIEEALRSHPVVWEQGIESRSESYRDIAVVAAPFDSPLPEPDAIPDVMAFDLEALRDLRGLVGTRAIEAGLTPGKANDLVLAVNEVATNSLRHGGGQGVLRVWFDGGSLIAEIRDQGRIDRPLIGRERPLPEQDGGIGLWLANQLCDLVQIRTFPEGSVVRLHMSRA